MQALSKDKDVVERKITKLASDTAGMCFVRPQLLCRTPVAVRQRPGSQCSLQSREGLVNTGRMRPAALQQSDCSPTCSLLVIPCMFLHKPAQAVQLSCLGRGRQPSRLQSRHACCVMSNPARRKKGKQIFFCWAPWIVTECDPRVGTLCATYT